MRVKLPLATLLAGMLTLMLVSTAAAGFSEIEANLMCTCGCSMVVNVCECGTADAMRDEITQLLDEGRTDAEVLQYFVDKHGESILAAPTKSGFNLTAWITPFAAIIAGGGALWVFLKRWQDPVTPEDTAETAVEDENLEEYEDILETERRRYL